MRRSILIGIALLLSLCTFAQMRKVQNRPYIDQRRIHYGFMIGLHVQDYQFVNNGLVTEEGEKWFADVPEYNPGFTVGVLGELYLTEHLSLRALPTLHFGSKRIVFREQITGKEESQSMTSSYVGLPIDVKFSADRCNNYRPYVMAGINPMFNMGIKRQKMLLVNPLEFCVEVGVGCDFYLPFFKLIPELKFSFGLNNLLKKNRTDLTDKSLEKFTQSIDRVNSRMIVLSFYFE